MITALELKLYRSLVINDTGTNGGRMSASEIVSGVMANLFPIVQEAERTAGSTKYRKVFAKVANDDDLTLYQAKLYLDKITPGQDIITFFPATQTNTQAAITGSERQYGGSQLNVPALAGDAVLAILVENGASPPIVNGDGIRISNKATIDAVTGTEEYLTVTSASVAGNVMTLGIAPVLANPYLTTDTRVMSVYRPASTDVAASVSDLVAATASTGDFTVANLLPDAIGGIEQTWTLTFTSATAFNIVGDTVGAVGSGNVGSGASPNNASFSKPYFVMQSAGFTGTFTTGDTIVFNTHPAAVPLWVKRVVPAACAVIADNRATLVFDGDTAE
jgi:hypothetical protein